MLTEHTWTAHCMETLSNTLQLPEAEYNTHAWTHAFSAYLYGPPHGHHCDAAAPARPLRLLALARA